MKEDDFVLGIISGNPSVLGNVYDDQWQGKFLSDIYGRPIMEEQEIPEERDDSGNIVSPARKVRCQKLNPEYNMEQEYIPRSERPEWDCVGMLGQLVVVDDGSCRINGWCRPGEGGFAAASEERTDFRVMRRIDETHVLVLMLGRR